MITGTEPPYFIRRATLDDVAEVARLAGVLGYPATANEISSRLKFADHPKQFVAVAAIENKHSLFGWIAAEERNLLIASPRVEITGLVVDQTARRTGVGRELVVAVEQWAKERGIGEILVRSNILREESHLFYGRLGYGREKSQHVYLKRVPRPGAADFAESAAAAL